MFRCLLLLLVPYSNTESTDEHHLAESLGLEPLLGAETKHLYLTIQNRKGVISWQGALMMDYGVGRDRNVSNDRNVCQRFNSTDYRVSEETAQAICKINNFHKVDSVRKLDYYATWWATEIESTALNLSCSAVDPSTGQTSCSWNDNYGECEGFDYYTTLSCMCNKDYYKTTAGCKQCKWSQACHGNETLGEINCIAGYEPDGYNGCDICDIGEFSDGEQYKWCTRCPAGAVSLSYIKCACDTRYKWDLGGAGPRVWDKETNTCIVCPEDTYRNITSSTCEQCPAGKHTYGTGKVDLDDCKSCAPDEVSVIGCVNKTLLIWSCLGGGIAVLVLLCCCCCCCCCGCCDRDKQSTRPPPVISHTLQNPAASPSDEIPAEMDVTSMTDAQFDIYLKCLADKMADPGTPVEEKLKAMKIRDRAVEQRPGRAGGIEMRNIQQPAPAPAPAPPLPTQPAYNPGYEGGANPVYNPGYEGGANPVYNPGNVGGANPVYNPAYPYTPYPPQQPAFNPGFDPPSYQDLQKNSADNQEHPPPGSAYPPGVPGYPPTGPGYHGNSSGYPGGYQYSLATHGYQGPSAPS